MKTIDEMIAVMTAYKEGKKIEFQAHFTEEWVCVKYPTWDWASNDYRVKSEPKYVPYDSVMEVDRDKWIARKPDTSLVHRISAVDSDNNKVFVAGTWWTMKLLLDRFVYEDGAPCGKPVE